MKSCLIGILGVDGVGKTTQINILKRKYNGYMGYVTNEPKFSSELRQILHKIAWSIDKQNAFDVFSAETITSIGMVEMLAKINNIISFHTIEFFDKYVESYLAYHQVYSKGSDDSINLIASKFPKLDVKIYLKIDFEQLKQRILLRNGAMLNNESEENLFKYKQCFDKLADSIPGMHTIDVTNKSITSVNDQINEIILEFFHKKYKQEEKTWS